MTSQSHKYAAFISYSHQDERWAKWLHRRLESFRVPRHLIGAEGSQGEVLAKIGRCFRDQSDLSASNQLADTLQGALQQSRSLIVVCSPQSVASPWVNKEIQYFRSLGRGQNIYALIVEGIPNSADASQECFPEALLEDESGARLEPLAADVRPIVGGKTDGFLKLVAALIGVDFDQLRRRHMRRRMQMVAGALVGAFAIAALTTALAVSAFLASKEARERRAQADDLIGFMLGDLRDNLEGLGRLDVLDQTVVKTTQYLQGADYQDAASGLHRAAAYTALSNIAYNRGRMDDAKAWSALAIAAAKRLPETYESRREAAVFAITAKLNAQLASDQCDDAQPLVEEGLGLLQPPGAQTATILSALAEASFLDAAGYWEGCRSGANLSRANELYGRCISRLKDAATGQPVALRLRCQISFGVNEFTVDRSTAMFLDMLNTSDDLSRDYGARADVMYVLMAALAQATIAFDRTGQPDNARRANDQAMTLGQRLTQFDPNNQEWQLHYAKVLDGAIEMRLSASNWEEALTLSESLLDITERGMRLGPQQAVWAKTRINAFTARVVSMVELGRDDQTILAEIRAALAVPYVKTPNGGSAQHVNMLGWQWLLSQGNERLRDEIKKQFLTTYAEAHALRPFDPSDFAYLMKAFITSEANAIDAASARLDTQEFSPGTKVFWRRYCRQWSGRRADWCIAFPK